MKFIYRDQHFILQDDQKEYLLPDEEIARLINRPRTRVLRYLDAENVKSVPLDTPIGEIEGFELIRTCNDIKQHIEAL